MHSSDSFFLIIVIMFHIAVNNFYFLYTKLLVYYDLVIEMLLIRNATAAFTILAK